MNDNNPICSHCLVEIVYDEMTDESFDISTYEASWRGICPICGRRFIWKEVYRYSHLEYFEEEVDNG